MRIVVENWRSALLVPSSVDCSGRLVGGQSATVNDITNVWEKKNEKEDQVRVGGGERDKRPLNSSSSSDNKSLA